MSEHQTKGTALITGASSGIGAIYADRLARRGYDLILVARNAERLQTVADAAVKATGRAVRTVVADLGEPADVARIEALLRDDATITMLVNNAGVGAVTPLIQSDIGAMTRMIDLNVTALTRLTYAAVPGFVTRGAGAIINIASIVAISPEILNGVYGASKAFVLALTQSLQHELADKGIRIQAVLPGATATEFWEVAGMHHSDLPESWVMTSADLVDAALVGFDLGEVVTIPPLQDEQDWTVYENARRAMSEKLSNARPAGRYLPASSKVA